MYSSPSHRHRSLVCSPFLVMGGSWHSYTQITCTPCREYLPTKLGHFGVNVGKYTIHGASGIVHHYQKTSQTYANLNYV